MQISKPRSQSILIKPLLKINCIKIMLAKEKISEIIALLQSGLTPQQVADKTNASYTTIKRIRQNNAMDVIIPIGGRPAKLSDRNILYMMHLITSNKAISSIDLKHSLNSMKIYASPSTIRRSLRKEGMNAITVKPKPYLSLRHKRLRLQFALMHKDWTLADWTRVIFSDETKINRFGSDGPNHIWKRPSRNILDREISGTVKFGGGSLMMYGCITHDGPGYACRIDGSMNAELYTEILDDELMQTIDFYKMDKNKVIYAQDNDPKHTANLTCQWFQTNQIKLLACPPQSPDLNPIEHIWHILKLCLNAYRKPPIGMNDLWERVEAEWENINPEICRVLIESMPKRMKAVIKVHGGYIKY